MGCCFYCASTCAHHILCSVVLLLPYGTIARPCNTMHAPAHFCCLQPPASIWPIRGILPAMRQGVISRIRTITPVEDRAAGVCMLKWVAPSIAIASSAHKWLQCMMSTQQPNSADAYFHLRAPCNISYANIRLLCDESDSLPHCLQYSDAVVPLAACNAETHRKILKNDIHKFDVIFRRLLRSVVGPGDVDRTRAWHEILHVWNLRIREQSAPCNIDAWSTRCSKTHWKFASQVA